jgi:hypothetical protein
LAVFSSASKRSAASFVRVDVAQVFFRRLLFARVQFPDSQILDREDEPAQALVELLDEGLVFFRLEGFAELIHGFERAFLREGKLVGVRPLLGGLFAEAFQARDHPLVETLLSGTEFFFFDALDLFGCAFVPKLQDFGRTLEKRHVVTCAMSKRSGIFLRRYARAYSLP